MCMLPVSVLEMWLLLFSWLFGFKVYAFNIYVLAVFVRDKALSAINQPVFPREVICALEAVGWLPGFRFCRFLFQAVLMNLFRKYICPRPVTLVVVDTRIEPSGLFMVVCFISNNPISCALWVGWL